MGYFFRDWLHPSVVVCLALILYFFPHLHSMQMTAKECPTSWYFSTLQDI